MGIVEDLTGLQVRTFMRDRWERELVIAQTSVPAPVSSATLETALEVGTVRPADVAAFRDGALAPASSYEIRQGGRAHLDVPALARLFDAGYTVVVNGIDSWSPAVADLAGALAEALEVGVGINAYYTPPANQGFALHADGHDVLVWQLEGDKAWEIWTPPVQLPLEPLVGLQEEEPAAIRETLRPGTVIYLPRGWPHAARSTGDGASLHLTIGLRAYTWREELHRLVDTAAAADVALRGSASADGRELPELLELLRREWRPEDAADARARHWIGSLDGPLLGHFGGARAAHLDGRRVFRRRASVRAAVLTVRDETRLQLASRHVPLPASCAPATEWALSHYTAFTAEDLPTALHAAERDVLLDKLVAEGVLTEHAG